MSCYYCALAGVSAQSRGACTSCGVDVCTPPPSDPEAEVHGERCRCGCDRLFCNPHVAGHARDNHASDPELCFPALSALLAFDPLIDASDALTSGRVEDRLDPRAATRINRFLNTITPGHPELVPAVLNLSSRLGMIDDDVWRASGEHFVAFGTPFYTEGTLERVFVLAARTVGATFRRIQPMRLWRRRDRQTEAALERAMIGLALWTEDPDAALPSATKLEALVAPEHRPRATRLRQILATTYVPDGAAAVAGWLAREHLPVVAGAGA